MNKRLRYIGADDGQVRWGNNADPRSILHEGCIYEVEKEEVHSWHTKTFLKDFSGLGFNSVCFEEVTNELPPVEAELLQALRAITSNKHISLGDLIYQVRDAEGLGWDGPQVTQWSNAVATIDALLLKYKVSDERTQ